MKTGTVIGRIVASKRLPELPPGALLEVQLDYPRMWSSASTRWAAASASA